MQWVSDTDGGSCTQGTILEGLDWGEDANPLGVVLSNACDFENDKLSFIVVAALVPAKETLEATKEYKKKVEIGGSKNGLSTKQKNAFKEYLLSFIHNKTICRYYYFNPAPAIDSDPLLIDFQRIKSFDIQDVLNGINEGHIERIGQFNHPFVEQIMSHFVGYVGRVPSDRVPDDEIESELNLISNHLL